MYVLLRHVDTFQHLYHQSNKHIFAGLKMEPEVGIKPTTFWLQIRYSITELHRLFKCEYGELNSGLQIGNLKFYH